MFCVVIVGAGRSVKAAFFAVFLGRPVGCHDLSITSTASRALASIQRAPAEETADQIARWVVVVQTVEYDALSQFHRHFIPVPIVEDVAVEDVNLNDGFTSRHIVDQALPFIHREFPRRKING